MCTRTRLPKPRSRATRASWRSGSSGSSGPSTRRSSAPSSAGPSRLRLASSIRDRAYQTSAAARLTAARARDTLTRVHGGRLRMAAPSRAMNIGAWVASALLAALYVTASLGKLRSDPQMVEAFTKYGHSDGFRLFIGTCEMLGAIALLIPRLAFWAAIGLLIIMIGAVYTHVSTNDAAHMGPAVIALVLLAFIAYTRRPQALLLS